MLNGVPESMPAMERLATGTSPARAAAVKPSANNPVSVGINKRGDEERPRRHSGAALAQPSTTWPLSLLPRRPLP